MKKIKIISVIIILCLGLCSCEKYDKFLSVHIIDVGQGDSILIKTPNNKNILIDGGDEDNNKIIVARTKEESEAIKKIINKEYLSFHATDFSGALVLLDKNGTEDDKVLAARMAARYSKGREEEKVKIKFGIYGTKLDNHIEVEPINDNELEKYMISIK